MNRSLLCRTALEHLTADHYQGLKPVLAFAHGRKQREGRRDIFSLPVFVAHYEYGHETLLQLRQNSWAISLWSGRHQNQRVRSGGVALSPIVARHRKTRKPALRPPKSHNLLCNTGVGSKNQDRVLR